MAKGVLVLCLIATVPALATVINFDNLSNGDVVTNQYAGVVFSSTTGFVNFVTTQPAYQSTPPNFICSGPAGGSIDCAHETILTFSSAANGLSFDALGINDVSANVAQVDVFTNGVFNSTVIIPGNAQGFAPEHIDLSAFAGVTKIRIYNITDAAGIGWDTFTYNQSLGTPEPAAWMFAGSGLLLLMLGRVSGTRRRRS